MPRAPYPKDRFDDLPQPHGRVGAHRAENPHLNGWAVFLWAALATVVLVAAGIFGTLVVSGRVTLFPTPTPSATPTPEVTPVIDTSYAVSILNATTEDGLATKMKDVVTAAGWAPDAVLAGSASSTGFPTTTVFYSAVGDEAAAKGLAGVIGGAQVEQSAAYQPLGNPDAKQLTIVIGLDRTANPPKPTPSQ